MMGVLLPCKACGHDRRVVSMNRSICIIACEKCGVGVEAEQPDAFETARTMWNELQSGEVENDQAPGVGLLDECP